MLLGEGILWVSYSHVCSNFLARFGEYYLWIRRSVVRVHPAVPDKLAKYLEIFDAPIVMHFASWWGSTREALRKLGLRHLQKDQ